jgi:hypothetical protein
MGIRDSETIEVDVTKKADVVRAKVSEKPVGDVGSVAAEPNRILHLQPEERMGERGCQSAKVGGKPAGDVGNVPVEPNRVRHPQPEEKVVERWKSGSETIELGMMKENGAKKASE